MNSVIGVGHFTPNCKKLNLVIVKNLIVSFFLSLVMAALLSPIYQWAHILGAAAGLFLAPALVSLISGGLYRPV